MLFLVDTGANISVVPRSVVKNNSVSASKYILYAANGTEIKTYGEKTLELDLNLRRSFKWNFVVCEVKQPIIGADFLKYFKLMVDLDDKILVDKITNLKVQGIIMDYEGPTVKSINVNDPYHNLLKEFQMLPNQLVSRRHPGTAFTTTLKQRDRRCTQG